MLSWQYIAGIIDGEGSIGTTRTGKNHNVVGRVIVTNTDSRLLYALKETFQGTVSIRAIGAKENWKPYGSIAWSNRQAEQLLENVLPYLVIKKEQALLCLELIKMRNMPKNVRYDYIKSPYQNFPNRVVAEIKPQVREREETIVGSLHVLNKKGVALSEARKGKK